MAEGGLVSMNVETRNAAGSALVNISTETGGLSSTVSLESGFSAHYILGHDIDSA